jgi:hypothetical protein
MRNFLGNVAASKNAATQRIVGALYGVNKFMARFTSDRLPRQFYASGVSPVNVANDAIAAIDGLLK